MGQNKNIAGKVCEWYGHPVVLLCMGLFVLSLSSVFGPAVAPQNLDGGREWVYASRLQEYWECWRAGLRWQWAVNSLFGVWGAVMAAQGFVAVCAARLQDKELRGLLSGVAGYAAALASLSLPPLSLGGEGFSAGVVQWLDRAWCGGWMLNATGKCEIYLWEAMDRASLVPLTMICALLAWGTGSLLEKVSGVDEKKSSQFQLSDSGSTQDRLGFKALVMGCLSKPWFWLIVAGAVLMLGPIFEVKDLPRVGGESEWEYSYRAHKYWSEIARWQYVANGLLWTWAFAVGAQCLVLIVQLRGKLRGIGLGLGVVGCAASFASVYWPTYSEAHFLAATLSEMIRLWRCVGAAWVGWGQGCQESYSMSMLKTSLVPFGVVAMVTACASGYMLIRFIRKGALGLSEQAGSGQEQ